MSNDSNNIGTNPLATPAKRGPKPIKTLDQLQAALQQEILMTEVRKIDKKIATHTRARKRAQAQISDCDRAVAELTALRAEFLKTYGLA